jgi:hypothetical protein
MPESDLFNDSIHPLLWPRASCKDLEFQVSLLDWLCRSLTRWLTCESLFKARMNELDYLKSCRNSVLAEYWVNSKSLLFCFVSFRCKMRI